MGRPIHRTWCTPTRAVSSPSTSKFQNAPRQFPHSACTKCARLRSCPFVLSALRTRILNDRRGLQCTTYYGMKNNRPWRSLLLRFDYVRQSTISRPTRTHGTNIGSADDGSSNGINAKLNGSFTNERAFYVPSQSAPPVLRKIRC
jgi:hypothetical protein